MVDNSNEWILCVAIENRKCSGTVPIIITKVLRKDQSLSEVNLSDCMVLKVYQLV